MKLRNQWKFKFILKIKNNNLSIENTPVNLQL